MSSGLAQRERFVVPGERLGVVEEFLPGPGTYVEDGVIYSQSTGDVQLDLKNKTVRIAPRTQIPVIPREGETVIGVVTQAQAQDKQAVVSILKIGRWSVAKPFTGILHISASSPRFEKFMSDVCKAGDYIRAKVIDVSTRVPMLTTADRGLGVIKAFCSLCGGKLVLRGRRLECTNCSNLEQRRIADDFMN